METRSHTATHSRFMPHLGRAIVLALAVTIGAGIPGLPAGPGGGPLVQTASATTYVRVSSLSGPTRATQIVITRLRINMPIRAGAIGATISTRYAYHYPTTSWPGGHSNTYLYAHAWLGAFYNLRYARRGDIISVRLATGRWVKYKVWSVYKVAWNAGKWVLPTSSERLTLQTCLGTSKTANRLIVIAVPAY